VTDKNGCTIDDSISIGQPDSLLLDTSIVAATCQEANGSATVSVDGGSRPYTYLWKTTPVQTDSTAKDLAKGDYWVIVTDKNKCVDSISAFVNDISTGEICDSCVLKIYNGISPNEDGINDTWIIDGIIKIATCRSNKYKVKIYNRWGDKVWEGKNYDNGPQFGGNQVWDGNNKHGSPLPDGTYYYVIEIENPTGQDIYFTNDNNEHKPYNPKKEGIHGWVQILR